ncbi:hypothetical protein [Scytonema sp. UIC 10036]|uniref:hypothetical protein n=1 Tax=Scytonema sp. UIC 10036 TaxID=2304196 RepID=UPI00140FEBF2|nr:hypothetical protein [Scytonema sp. UIC 10036]
MNKHAAKQHLLNLQRYAMNSSRKDWQKSWQQYSAVLLSSYRSLFGREPTEPGWNDFELW